MNLKTEDAEKYQQAVKIMPILPFMIACGVNLSEIFVVSVAIPCKTVAMSKSLRGINFQFWNTPPARSEAEYRILVV